MVGLRIAAIVTAFVALAIAPAVAQATVTTSQITSWTSSEPGTPANNPYLISYDNQSTTLTVSGVAPGATNADQIDVVCYYGATPSVAKLAGPVSVHNATFTTGAVPLKPIAGHACRLRAIPTNTETSSERASFAAQQVAVSEAALPVAIASGPNAGAPFNFYVNDVTFSGYAVWSAPGTPAQSLSPFIACGGPEAAPVDSSFDVGNFAIDCTGSLLSDDLGVFGGRSEIQVDGRNAYDPAAAQSLFAPAGSNPASENLTGFPKTLATFVQWDPTTGLMSSQSTEPLVECNWPTNTEMPTFASCPSFVDSGVKLERDIATSDGGRVVTMTDTWLSTDGKAHAVDLLYDNAIGVKGDADGDRGYEFPGQTTFSQYTTGTKLTGSGPGPASILVRTNVTVPDGDPSEAAGAITFGSVSSGYAFTTNGDFEDHQVLTVPAGGRASLSYIYSVGYSVADVTALARAAQDRFESPSVTIGSPADGTTVTSPTVTVSGTTSAGSGITSLMVDGQPVPVAPDGSWTAQVPLSLGANTISAIATDRAGATAQAQVAVSYEPSASPAAPGPAPAPAPGPVKCRVPRVKGMKLAAAEKAVRSAHCRVGKIKHVRSRGVRTGRVASASPGGGHTLPLGHKVELFVSKGR